MGMTIWITHYHCLCTWCVTTSEACLRFHAAIGRNELLIVIMGGSHPKLARKRISTLDDERVFFTNKDAELIPAYIFHKDITSLDLSFNRLVNIPKETSLLRKLKVLRIQCNLVQMIPQALCDAMLPLEHLVLDRNQLAVVPDCIGNLTSLIQLHLSRNKVSLSMLLVLHVPHIGRYPMFQIIWVY